jgi:helicase
MTIKKSLEYIYESSDLKLTADYPYAKFPFEKFNPVQTGLLKTYEQDTNCIVAASTSAGKTVCFEIYASHTIRKHGKKAIYLSPLKSLSQEKYDDWTDPSHHFSDLKVAICTGDYRMTPARKQELDEANIIIMTSEMLNSMSRNFFSEKNKFLSDVGLVGIDESHLLGVVGRGGHLESGIIKFTESNPEARLLLLSATMPNVDEIGKWINSLNDKTTLLLESDYRPCKLNIHYERYYNLNYGYDAGEEQKVALTIKLLKKYPNDKFICFVHTKRTGELLQGKLNAAKISNHFHNANLEKNERVKIERQFRENPDLRVIVATSGLAQGLNMPARRIVIVGIHRGMTEVDTHEIVQECGRAGRPQYDPEGDAYVLVPSSHFAEHVARLTEPQLIKSQMQDFKTLAFHLVSEIHHKSITNMDDVHKWYSRTLAHFQQKDLDEEDVRGIIKNLVMCGCVREEDGQYVTTTAGTVASMFYYSPYDVADLSRNFTRLFQNNLADNDVAVCMALANLDGYRNGIVNKAEQYEMETFGRLITGSITRALSPKVDFTPATIKTAYCYHLLMKGEHSVAMNNTMRTLQMDFGRASEVLSALDSMGSKWDEAEFFKLMKLRVSYGVPIEMVELCQIKGIGKAKAKKLYAMGMRTPNEVNDVVKVIKALNCSKKVAEDTIANAKTIK